jgi:diadenosine tetraphosphatase ApaH/serine/threonine PP2A family protein phosphatase
MAAFSGTPLLFVVTLVFHKVVSVSSQFLGSRAQHESAEGLRHVMDVSNLLFDLEEMAGRDHRLTTQRRASRLEKVIRPMYLAMPKNSFGNLDGAGVRFLLHRVFVQRHGWFVDGLHANGNAWNSSSPTAIFEQHAKLHRTFFEEKLAREGFDLHHVSVFAAALETLVHGESEERLRAAYRLLDLSSDENLPEGDARKVVRAYMLMYIHGSNYETLTTDEFETISRRVNDVYATWPETEQFADEVRKSVLEDIPTDERNTWNATLQVLEEVGERYGRWQDKECRELKHMLVQREVSGSGRVLLEDFYGNALTDANWLFLESVPYLRQLGALDESDPLRLKVIIPNYLNSPSNCVASSKFYSVCCIDECEALVSSLELKIAAPEATLAQITDLVAVLPSATVEAPRELPTSLVSRLAMIAMHHDGVVPLHGRLFSQWMHHAFPRECPFPHESGTTRPVSQDAWVGEKNQPIMASRDEIQQLIEETSSFSSTDEIEVMEQGVPWTAGEELFVSSHRLPRDHSEYQIGMGIIAFLSFSSAGLMFLRSGASAFKRSKCGGLQKYVV